MRIYTVSLEGMSFTGFHGCREDEKKNGNIFSVDFEGSYESPCAATDNLGDTVNYGRIYQVIASVMHGQRRNLLETLASDIADALQREFPEFLEGEVRVGKKNPPVAGPCEWSRVSASWRRND